MYFYEKKVCKIFAPNIWGHYICSINVRKTREVIETNKKNGTKVPKRRRWFKINVDADSHAWLVGEFKEAVGMPVGVWFKKAAKEAAQNMGIEAPKKF